MRILCLCPTFRRPQLLANLLACFEAQDHCAKFLLALDDSGELSTVAGNRWELISRSERLTSLTAKYRELLRIADRDGIDYDAVALMDDDDIYGPQYLSSHAAALSEIRRGQPRWSYPEQVWSTHAPPAATPTQPGLEPSAGRFWASAAVSRGLLEELGGFQEIQRPTFDQEHLALWQAIGGRPGRPDRYASPQYVYGWGRAPRHVSLEMGNAAGWYQQYAASCPAAAGKFAGPAMDSQTQGIYAHCWPDSLPRKDPS